MIDIDTSDRKEQRNFGLVMAGAFTLLGFVRWGLHWRASDEMPSLPYVFLVVAAVFLFLGLVAPRSLEPLFVVWIKLALVLNWIVTHIVLSIAFFLTVLPIGILIRLFGNDPLDRALDSDAESYWKKAEYRRDDPDQYTKQF